jgi:hypothetical protein
MLLLLIRGEACAAASDTVCTAACVCHAVGVTSVLGSANMTSWVRGCGRPCVFLNPLKLTVLMRPMSVLVSSWITEALHADTRVIHHEASVHPGHPEWLVFASRKNHKCR